jgi:hypothetical protein
MTTPTKIIFSATLAAIVLLGCGPAKPCADGCDDDVGSDLPSPDLPTKDLPPCGDVDLQTDNQNCGSCGHECYIQDGAYFEPEWNGGGACMTGACGSIWSQCDGEGFGSTCREILEKQGYTCATGCVSKTPGTTALFFDLQETLGGSCWINGAPVELALGCDDPIPWDPGTNQSVQCCMAQP